jgi:hypothetical protein
MFKTEKSTTFNNRYEKHFNLTLWIGSYSLSVSKQPKTGLAASFGLLYHTQFQTRTFTGASVNELLSSRRDCYLHHTQNTRD